MFCLDLVAGWTQIKNKSCSENGTIVFCLVLKINKISKISRGWEVSCILRMKYQRKTYKMLLFSEQLRAKKTKNENYSVCLTNEFTLTNYSQENRGNCLLFLGSVTPTGLEVSFHLFVDWFSPKMKQTISKQQNWALPWQCKNIWILQFFGNAELIFLAFS